MNATIQDTTQLIEKESIVEFSFPKGDVLDTEEKREERQARIKEGCVWGIV